MSIIEQETGHVARSSTPKPAIELVPPEVLELLGDPPLIRGENPDDYDRLFGQFAATIEPKDFVEWMLTKDVLDLVWEIRRWRQIKSAFFDNELYRSGSQIVGELLEDEAGGFLMNAERNARQLIIGSTTGDPASQSQLQTLLEENGLNHNSILSHALVRRLHDIERLEKLMSSAERRRDDTLKSIERRRQSLASRLQEEANNLIEELELETKPNPPVAFQ